MKKLIVLLFLAVSFFGLKAQNPCTYQYGANEQDSLRCLEKIFLFRNYYDQKNYVDAYIIWQDIVHECPCSWNGIFSYAQTMFDGLITATTDSLQKEVYVDSLFWSYDMRHVYFPKNFTEGSGLGFKAYNTMRYRSKNYEQAYDWFTTSIELEKDKTQPHIWDIFFKTAEFVTKVKKDTTIIIEAYERATEYIDAAINNAYKQYEKQLPNFANLDSAVGRELISQMEYNRQMKNLQDDTTRQMRLVANYSKTLSNIEGVFTPYAPCHVLEQVYGKKLEENKNNAVALKKIVMTMSKGGCTASSVFKQALELLHQLEPGAQSAFHMGNFALQNNELDKAIEYFREAIDLFETNEQKVMPYYMLGLTYMAKNNYSEARAAANNAIKIKPNFGRAYILIGDLYKASAGICSGGDQLPYATNWAAADKYNRAAAVDPTVADEAASKRAGLKYPSMTDKHTRGLSDGQTYPVGCWIQETTTVR